MTTDQQQNTQKHLRKILALLGPGITVHVDDRFLVAAFGRDDMNRKSKEFATRHHCAFRYEGDDLGGHFVRAYFA